MICSRVFMFNDDWPCDFQNGIFTNNLTLVSIIYPAKADILSGNYSPSMIKILIIFISR